MKNAIKKLKNKNLDGIVLNSLKDDGSGFFYDSNKITFIEIRSKVKIISLKIECAKIILMKFYHYETNYFF